MLLQITFQVGSNAYLWIMSGILAEIDDLPEIVIFKNVLFHATSLFMYRFYHAGSTFLCNFMPFPIISFQFISMNFDRKTGEFFLAVAVQWFNIFCHVSWWFPGVIWNRYEQNYRDFSWDCRFWVDNEPVFENARLKLIYLFDKRNYTSEAAWIN